MLARDSSFGGAGGGGGGGGGQMFNWVRCDFTVTSAS